MNVSTANTEVLSTLFMGEGVLGPGCILIYAVNRTISYVSVAGFERGEANRVSAFSISPLTMAYDVGVSNDVSLGIACLVSTIVCGGVFELMLEKTKWLRKSLDSERSPRHNFTQKGNAEIP